MLPSAKAACGGLGLALAAAVIAVADRRDSGVAWSAAALSGACADLFDSTVASPMHLRGSLVSMAIGDFDGDRRSDVALGSASNIAPGGVRLLVAGRAGVVRSRGAIRRWGRGEKLVAAGDFDGDRHQDLVTVDTGIGAFNVLLGRGNGAFREPRSSPEPADLAAEALGVADINSDGRPDVVLVTSVSRLGEGVAEGPGRPGVSVHLGNGTGDFNLAPGSPYRGVEYPSSLAIGDVNRDGHPDVLVGDTSNSGAGLRVLLGSASGALRPARTSVALVATEGSGALALGDFNDDAKPDLVLGYSDEPGISVWLGDGTGGFARSNRSGTRMSYVTSVITGDFNDDGRTDVGVTREIPGRFTVLLGDGKGGLRETRGSRERVAYYSGGRALASGDFNRDGREDLAVMGWRYGGYSRLSILLRTRSPSFGQPPLRPTIRLRRSMNRLRFGDSVTLHARLECGGRPLVHRPVRLQARRYYRNRDGEFVTESWRSVVATATSSTGEAAARHAPAFNTQYRWRYRGGGKARPARSPAGRVYVRPRIAIHISPRPARRGQPLVVWGRVSPPSAGREARLLQGRKGRWRVVRAQRLDRRGRFRFVTVPQASGPTAYRIFVLTGRFHENGTSRSVRASVR